MRAMPRCWSVTTAPFRDACWIRSRLRAIGQWRVPSPSRARDKFSPSSRLPHQEDRMFRFAIAAAIVAAPASAATGGLAQVQAHLRAVSTMTANFAQTDRTGRTLTGTITLKQPGKVRFQYQKGVSLLIVG